MITKIIRFFYAFAILSTIPISLYTYSRVLAKDARIQQIEEILNREKGTIERDSLRNLLAIKDIEEAVFIVQLDKQVDSILTYMTVIFGIFGLVGLISFQYYIADIKEEQKRIKKQASKDRSEIKEGIANSYSALALFFQYQGKFGEAIIRYVNSIEMYLQGYLESGKTKDDFYDTVFERLDLAEECMNQLKRQPNTTFRIADEDLKDLKEDFKKIILKIDDGSIEQRMMLLRDDMLSFLL